jgi:hypothetical protein
MQSLPERSNAMRLLTFILLLSFFANASAQDLRMTEDNPLQLYNDVLSGRRSATSLTPEEKQQVLLMHDVFARSCGRKAGKCQAVCEAANDLEDAAKNLAQCARRHDFSNDCHSRSRDVRSAADNYESAVSDAAGDCD